MLKRIYLDPGHGGSDPGAVGYGLEEKALTLEMALALLSRLLADYGCEVKVSREADITVPLAVRVAEAENWDADLFFSIHCNGYGEPGPNGYEDYIHPSSFAATRAYQQIIHKHLAEVWANAGRADRGVKTADFFVLRETTKTPAILVEHGFLSNPEDANLLKDDGFKRRLVNAMAAAIAEALELQPILKGTSILGVPQATAKQAQAWAKSRNATQVFVDLAPLYWQEAFGRGGVRPEVAYAQSAKETAFGRFGGVVPGPEWHNWCGLKTTAGGGNYEVSAHAKFPDDVAGVRAHLDHLALYAGAKGYPKIDTPDPRHFPYIAGTAKTVEELSGKWAGSGYGESLVTDYLVGLMATDETEMTGGNGSVEELQRENELLKEQVLALRAHRDSLFEVIKQVKGVLAQIE